MARLCLLHCIERESADCVDAQLIEIWCGGDVIVFFRHWRTHWFSFPGYLAISRSKFFSISNSGQDPVNLSSPNARKSLVDAGGPFDKAHVASYPVQTERRWVLKLLRYFLFCPPLQVQARQRRGLRLRASRRALLVDPTRRQ